MWRKTFVCVAVCTLAMPVVAEQASEVKSERQKYSYAIGYRLGLSLKRQDLDVDPEAVAEGLEDLLNGDDPAFSPAEMQSSLEAFQNRAVAERARRAERNREAGRAYLAANKSKPGVVELANGLQYKVITPGSGKRPQATDTVSVNYRGTLIDGSEFDSSYSRGEPTTFQVDQVIQGWQEALQLMAQGAKWEVVVPAELGYGESGAGGVIAPNSTLVFEIELLEVR